MGGRLIVLVGTSSVGKSSVAGRLQGLLPEPHLVVGIDHFLNMFPQRWAGHARGPGPGMWYEDSVDPDGSPRARIRRGEAGDRLLVGMRAAVVAMLDEGNHVILDEMPLDESIVPAWKDDLASRPSFWIRLTAPIDVVEAREAGRYHGQHLGNARGHFDIAATESYDLTIDASTADPERLAGDIVEALDAVDFASTSRSRCQKTGTWSVPLRSSPVGWPRALWVCWVVRPVRASSLSRGRRLSTASRPSRS